MLHLIQKSPFQTNCLEQCLSIASTDDHFLLMSDGIYALQKNDFVNHFDNIYVLETDLQARGLAADRKIKTISHKQFVELTLQHDKSLSWF